MKIIQSETNLIDFRLVTTHRVDREELLLQDCEWKIRSTERACKERINAAEQAKNEAIKQAEKIATESEAQFENVSSSIDNSRSVFECFDLNCAPMKTFFVDLGKAFKNLRSGSGSIARSYQRTKTIHRLFDTTARGNESKTR